MPLHLERIDWMPSPPLAPDDGPIDTEHLMRNDAWRCQPRARGAGDVLGPGRRAGRQARHAAFRCPRAGPYAEGLGARDRRVCASPMPPRRWKPRSGTASDPHPALAELARCRRRGPHRPSTRYCAGPDFPASSRAARLQSGRRFSPRPLARSGSTRYRTARTSLIRAARAIMAKITLCRPYRRNPHH